MQDDSRIMREFQRLSVGGFDELQNTVQQYNNHNNNHKDNEINFRNKNKPNHTFNSLQNNLSPSPNNKNILNGKEKYFNYIHSDNDNYNYNEYNNNNNNEYNNEYPDTNTNANETSISVDEIINDLKRRKVNRLKNNKNSKYDNNFDVFSPMTPKSPSVYSRFMLAATNSNNNNNNKYEIEKYKDIINNKDNEIKLLQKQLEEKEEIIESLHNKLDNMQLNQFANVKTGNRNRHKRQKSMTQTQTEQSTIENVRWSLRSEIAKMTTAENDINRLLQSVGDTSMIHARLKKIYQTITAHKRKVSALEQSLNVDEFGINGINPLNVIDGDNEDNIDNIDTNFDENKLRNIFNNNNYGNYDDEKKDFEILSKEYTKLKLHIAELKQEQNEWNNTKEELSNINKRCTNLMNMLDKLSDEKLELTLQIEDLNAFIHKHNLIYNR